jgi:hypothetical protein
VRVEAAGDLVQRRIRQSFDFVIDDVGHSKSPVGQFAWRFKHRRIIARLQRPTVTDLTELIRHLWLADDHLFPA